MRFIKAAVLAALALAWAGADAGAQPSLTRERERRLAQIGRVVSDQPLALYPIAGMTVAAATVPARTGQGVVRSMRLHFSVNAGALRERGQQDKWSLRVSDAAERFVWKFAAADDPEAEEFWSPEVPGDVVRVSVSSAVPDSALRLIIEERIEYLDPISQQSIVHKKDLSTGIRETKNRDYIRWGRAVARLTFIGEETKQIYTCTGFLVAPDLFMTNEHCPRTPKEVGGAFVEFDYDDEEHAQTEMYRLRVENEGEELPRDSDLDFALYRLNRPPPRREHLRLKDGDRDLSEQMPVVIIQHPSGHPKRVASYMCQLPKPAPPELQPPTDFGHECDTEGGSSGSPVLDLSGAVIGIHHYGFKPSDTLRLNQAVKMGEILNFIKKTDDKDGVYKSLTAGGH